LDADFRTTTERRLKDILHQWKDVEYWIKRHEHMGEGVLVAAINELRYAGRMLYGAMVLLSFEKNLDSDKCLKISNKITIAEQYLVNAQHDLIDAVVIMCTDQLEQVLDQYRWSDIEAAFPELKDHESRLKSVQETIQRVRRSPDDEINVYLGEGLTFGGQQGNAHDYKKLKHSY